MILFRLPVLLCLLLLWPFFGFAGGSVSPHTVPGVCNPLQGNECASYCDGVSDCVITRKDLPASESFPYGACQSGRTLGGVTFQGCSGIKAASPPTSSCPENSDSSMVDGHLSCTCSGAYTPNEANNACNPPPPGTPDKIKQCSDAKDGYDNYTGGAYQNPNSAFCGNDGSPGAGCGAKVTGGFAVVKDGKKVWTLEVKYDGSTCDPAPVTPEAPQAAPTPCKGQQGTVNGVTVCIPAPANAVTVEKKVTGTITIPGSEGAPAIKVSTVETTTCAGPQCTTTKSQVTDSGVPYVPASGPVGTVNDEGQQLDSIDKPRDSFCKENPSSPMCKSGSFSGSCGAGFTCDGDAVQCAIAQAAMKNACILEPDTDSASVANKALSGSDGINAETMQTNAQVVNVGTFSSTGRGWSRSCPADPVVELSWTAQSFTVPMSKLCGPLGLLANVAVGITALGCLVFCVRGGAGG